MPDAAKISLILSVAAECPGSLSASPGWPHTGDICMDLACHDLVRLTPRTPRFHWRGDTFFFCSSFCRQRFAISPDAYLAVSGNHEHAACTGGKNAAA